MRKSQGAEVPGSILNKPRSVGTLFDEIVMKHMCQGRSRREERIRAHKGSYHGNPRPESGVVTFLVAEAQARDFRARSAMSLQRASLLGSPVRPFVDTVPRP